MRPINHDYIWMKVTPDKYEFPLLIADSAQELAELMGLKVDTIRTQEMRHRNEAGCKRKYKIVRVKK